MDRESFFGTRSILRQIALLEVELLLSGLERLSVHFLCCRYKYHLISHIYRAPNSPLTMSWQQELESQNLFDVTGFVAVVTGGGSGIGLMARRPWRPTAPASTSSGGGRRCWSGSPRSTRPRGRSFRECCLFLRAFRVVGGGGAISCNAY